MIIKTLRKEYRHDSLSRSDLSPDPFDQFIQWISLAIDQEIIEANAMTLATATKNGLPSSRTVLLKEVDAHGFIFYTNYQSRKGQEIEENPFGSITFYWKELEKQVCIDGKIEKISREKSTQYFHSRPRDSQIGAYTSKQGQELASREELLKTYLEHEKQFVGQTIPLPEYWGGYRLVPQNFIFWQGRENRLHDRFLYTMQKNGTWTIKRLSP
ncbi:MAG: pyridoxamine 5'-phosphate oxidase [Chlamydiota bacterium]|nr:pyridoxamine 5'-phosphate oxidase [Chlamydiota bacterium]